MGTKQDNPTKNSSDIQSIGSALDFWWIVWYIKMIREAIEGESVPLLGERTHG